MFLKDASSIHREDPTSSKDVSVLNVYLFILAAIIVAFLIIKKVVSCFIRSVVLIVLAAVLGYIYWMYLR